MRLDSDKLNALSAIVSQGGFNRAARFLGVTQSALTQRIQKLEDHLETSLLIRESSGVRLTPSGEVLLRYAQAATQLEEEALNELRGAVGEVGGPVRIGAYSSVARSLIIPSLRPLARRHGGLQFEVFSREMRDLLPMLSRGEVDCVIINHEVSSPHLTAHTLGTEENVYITPDREGYPRVFLDHDPEDPTTFRFFQGQRKEPKDLKRSFFDDVYGIIDGVKNGLGQAIVSRHLLHKIQGIRIQRGYQTLKDPIVMVTHRTPYTTKKQSLLIETLMHEVPKQLSKLTKEAHGIR